MRRVRTAIHADALRACVLLGVLPVAAVGCAARTRPEPRAGCIVGENLMPKHTLAYWLLPIRRIWWFFTDWHTYLTFKFPCKHCQEECHVEGKGFWITYTASHQRVCKYSRVWNDVWHKKWWTCRLCIQRVCIFEKYYIGWRWDFRNKYNWGVIV